MHPPHDLAGLIPEWSPSDEAAWGPFPAHSRATWSRFGRRDQAPAVHHRFMAFTGKVREVGEGAAKRKVITMRASSPDPVDWGGWREILAHRSDSVDFGAATALLLNHDPNRIIGALTNIRVTPAGMEMDAELLDGAVLDSGVSVADAIDSGALRGVSIGYWYRMDDCTWDESTRTLTVGKWRLLESSLTPIPADDSAGLRQRSAPILTTTSASTRTDKEFSMDYELWLKQRGYDLAKLTAAEQAYLRALYADKGAAAEVIAGFAPQARLASSTAAPVVGTAPSEAARSAEIAAQREIAKRAESLGLTASDFVGMSREDANQAMVTKMAERAIAGNPGAGAPAHTVVVTRDAGDKMLERARVSLYIAAGLEGDDEADKKLIRNSQQMNMRSMLRAIARASGEQSDDWSEIEMAAWGSRLLDLRSHGRRDGSANKIVANFSNILANVANKAVQGGLDGYDSQTWDIFSTQRTVPNFLQVTNANLASGYLTQTKEDIAFPELLQKDGGYNSQLAMYGATLSVSFQAMINDQLGKIMGDLRRIGLIAAETIDREVYRTLLGLTWTNDVTASAPLSSPDNLDLVRTALRKKLSPAGVPLGTVGRFLIHDPGNARPAQTATGEIYSGGQTTTPSKGAKQVTTVESQWVSDTTLLAGALKTDYYLAGNPGIVDTILVHFLEGLGMKPMILPYDAGAVAAENWKIILPFSAQAATYTDSTGQAGRLAGLQKGTA